MKTKDYQYVEWMSGPEMHEHTKGWVSELAFVGDEQLFLNELIKSHTLELLEFEQFDSSKELVDDLLDLEFKLGDLVKKVEKHKNQLEIIVDDVDQIEMEKAYRKTHQNLSVLIGHYILEYRAVKAGIFKLLSSVLKKGKQNRLLNE